MFFLRRMTGAYCDDLAIAASLVCVDQYRNNSAKFSHLPKAISVNEKKWSQ